MRALRYAFPIRLAAAAIAMIAAGQSAQARADEGSFLAPLRTVATVATTVPANGDLNPYGIALVKKTVGALRSGSVLISNLYNAANLQGTGSTIVAVDPLGRVSLFARIEAARLKRPCPGGVGLTTALTVLERGWVIVGSLPSATGQSASAEGGCLIVLDAQGRAVTTLYGAGINGPWDMAAFDEGDSAQLFVSNVLNGDVTSGAPHRVYAGTVLRIGLEIPEQGAGVPRRAASTVIGSGFAQTADPAALVIGPTGVALSWDGTLYVADTLNNRIAAIADARTRSASAGTGATLTQGGALNGPLGLSIAPNGHVLTVNAGDGNAVETAPAGKQVAVKTLDTATGAGSLFGLVVAPGGRALLFVEDGDNTLKVLLP